MKIKDRRFTMTIRDASGEVLAEGTGHSFGAALTRLYREHKLGPGRRVGLHEYFATGRGYPDGTHHVQMAEPNGALDAKVVVQVRKLGT